MLHPRYFLLQIQTKINQFQTIFTRQFEPFALVFGIQFLLWLFNHWRATIAPFSLNFLLKTLHLFKFHENKFQNEKKTKVNTSFSIWWYVSWTSVILSQNLLDIKPTDIVQLIVRLWGLFFLLVWRSFKILLSQSLDTDCSNRQNLNNKLNNIKTKPAISTYSSQRFSINISTGKKTGPIFFTQLCNNWKILLLFWKATRLRLQL